MGDDDGSRCDADALETKLVAEHTSVHQKLKQVREWTIQVTGAALGFATDLYVSPGASVVVTPTATSALERLWHAAQDESVASIADVQEDMDANIAMLQEQTGGQLPRSVDLTKVLSLYIEAYGNAPDDRMRETIQRALVNAFDPVQYKLGLTRTLFEKLGQLEHGDVRALRELVAHPKSRDRSATPRTLEGLHLSNLVTHNLAWTRYPDNSGVMPTELGQRLVELLASSVTPK